MSRKGNCWDFAVMERFFLNLKMERVWQRDYANHTEAIRDITYYIVGFYNSERLHSTLTHRLRTEKGRGTTYRGRPEFVDNHYRKARPFSWTGLSV